MLMIEARWVGRVLSQLDAADLSPLLNVGSATAEFREKIQPWIDGEIFALLRARGVTVHHMDLLEGDAIDLRGDLTDDAFVRDLSTRGYKSLVCCNVLEHIVDPAAICAKLELLVPGGGYIVVAVPNRFPYHPDPIDTMFRPELEDLVNLFGQCRLLAGAVLDCGTGWDYVEREPKVLIAKLMRRLAGMREHGGIKGSASFLPWLFRRFRQNCALLKKS